MPQFDISKLAGASSLQKYLIPVSGFFIIMIFSSVGYSFVAQEDPRISEVTTTTAIGAGSVSCSDWGAPKSPINFQEKIEKAANEARIQPALLGAIFMSEHGNTLPASWGKINLSEQGGNAQGPFQIEEWANKWQQVKDQQGTTILARKIYPVPLIDKNSEGRPNDLYDSALAAAGYIRTTMRDAAFSNTLTTEENEIRCIGAGYNGGVNMCVKWKNGEYAIGGKGAPYSGNPPTTDLYHNRTWDNFSVLYQGCATYGGTASNTPVTMDSFEKLYETNPIVKSWYQKRKDRKMDTISKKATGITLHWTGAWDSSVSSEEAVKKLIDGWHDQIVNGEKVSVFNHLVIDPQGKVYQLIPLDVQQAGSGIGKIGGVDANDFTIGIEIAGSGPGDLSPQADKIAKIENEKGKKLTAEEKATVTKQYEATLAIVQLLLSNIPTIQNLRGDEANFQGKKGIFGHFQTSGGASGIVGCSESRGHPDPGLAFMKKLWDDLASKGYGCYVDKGVKLYYPPKI